MRERKLIFTALLISFLLTFANAWMYWNNDRPPALIYGALALISLGLWLKTMRTCAKNA